MRSYIIPRSRQISRICDACRQQQRNISTIHNLVSMSSISRRNTSSSTPSSRCHSNQIANRHYRRWYSNSVPTASEASPTEDSSSQQQVPQTHYDFFPQTLPQGPPPKGAFDIDVRTLRREFLQLQAKAHPDLHPAHLKMRAEATSARINDAFRTLCSPLLRAQYLLALKGRDVANDETAKVEDSNLLMEVLEMREEMEEAEDEADLEPLRGRVGAKEEESVSELARCFTEGDLDAAARECVRLRYWTNIREGIHNWEKGKPVVLQH